MCSEKMVYSAIKRRLEAAHSCSTFGGSRCRYALIAGLALALWIVARRSFIGPGELSQEERERGGGKSRVFAALFGIKKKIPLSFDVCYTTRDYQSRVKNGSLLRRSNPAHLLALERQRWDELKPHLPRIRGFYHTSLWRKYSADVILEQIAMMDARLLEVADLYLNVVGRSLSDLVEVQGVINNSDVGKNLKHKNRIVYNFNETVERFVYKRSKGKELERMRSNLQLSEGEYSTLKSMHDYCVQETNAGIESYVFYAHNKGGCCSRTKSSNRIDPTNDNVCAWREAMNAFNLEFPSVCARALRQGNYATCGFEFLVDYHTAHYSGNFFWANCRHIAALAPLKDRFDSFAAELFLFNRSAGKNDKEQNRRFGQRCGYSTFNCCMDFYKTECVRSLWDWKLLKMLGTTGMQGIDLSNTDLFGETYPTANECFANSSQRSVS